MSTYPSAITAPRPAVPAAITIRPSAATSRRSATLTGAGIERLVDEAVRWHDDALRDFRRVQSAARPAGAVLEFHARRVAFVTRTERAALSLERAGSALDDALFGLLQRLYAQSETGQDRACSARTMRRTLETLDELRRDVSLHQSRLADLVADI